jgi:hypothetical protein
MQAVFRMLPNSQYTHASTFVKRTPRSGRPAVSYRAFGSIVCSDVRVRGESGSERSRVRSGCLSLVARVGVVTIAAILAASSLALILSFAVSALGRPDGIEKIFEALLASVAGLIFFLVGRGIWRDLRRRPSAKAEGEKGPAEDRRP